MASSLNFFTFLILFFHFQHSSSFSLSVEKPEQDIIMSPKGTFTAGFYSVGENAYSFAIWFTQIHKNLNNATVVWMANRDQPVNGKRSTLSLLKTGNLVLTDAGHSNVWSTNTNSSKPLELFLYDIGNLVLRERKTNGFILWRSFDFPTDTLLPDQSFTRYMKLVSSKSDNVYSSGFYKLLFNNDNLLSLLYDGPQVSSIYWPDPWLHSWEARRSSYNNSRVAKLDVLGNFISSDVENMDKRSGRFQGNSTNNLSKYMEFVDLIVFALIIQELVESVCVFPVIAGSIIKIGLRGANQTSNFHAITKQS
ncbi:putative receptor protein kinase ZmPK1 [Medicago truncatula]|uniref:putative receptor protein kinase ZmPK1 n=1 Tax=Medicago truncatula TaxID=3880 RepID=UPI001967FBF0|nr:putative receptor protein kinase ZmPK1 [Medicago truncatula]